MIIAGLLALAATGAPLEPAGKWTVDYRSDMCVASRPFGDSATPTMFGFEPAVSMGSAGATAVIIAPDSRGGSVRGGTATIALEPSGEKFALDYVSWVPTGAKQRAYKVVVDGDFMAKLGLSTGLSMTAGKDSFALATGKVQPVLDAMKTCNDDLMRSWGVNLEAQAQPIGNPGAWFVNEDYPTEARRRNAAGRTVVVLTVDPIGRIKECRVVSSSKDSDLDKATCDSARKRARFKPVKTDTFIVLSVRWQLLVGF